LDHTLVRTKTLHRNTWIFASLNRPINFVTLDAKL
jgi:hypothetical protein